MIKYCPYIHIWTLMWTINQIHNWFTVTQKNRDNDDNMNPKHMCGISGWHPHWLQRFANTKTFMLVYGLLGTTQSMAFVYFLVTLTTIEKRFKIPSYMTGELMRMNVNAKRIALVVYGMDTIAIWFSVSSTHDISCLFVNVSRKIGSEYLGIARSRPWASSRNAIVVLNYQVWTTVIVEQIIEHVGNVRDSGVRYFGCRCSRRAVVVFIVGCKHIANLIVYILLSSTWTNYEHVTQEATSTWINILAYNVLPLNPMIAGSGGGRQSYKYGRHFRRHNGSPRIFDIEYTSNRKDLFFSRRWQILNTKYDITQIQKTFCNLETYLDENYQMNNQIVPNTIVC